MMNPISPFLLLTFIFLYGCGHDPVPKPEAVLRLEYPKAQYETFNKQGYYEFQKNKIARIGNEKEHIVNLEYPAMKATLFLTYKEIENNLNLLLADAQKLAYEHVVKADAITEHPFVNSPGVVYGMHYEIIGDAAS
ncbi:MAG: gliding motility lipoprotein GldD, partial [Bacteroidota bacterium]